MHAPVAPEKVSTALRAIRVERGSEVPAGLGSITLAWLIRLRWGAVVGQAAMILIAAYGLHVELPVPELSLLVMATACTNTVLAVRRAQGKEEGRGTVGAVLAADIVVITGLLYFSGGPANPFSVLYLVQGTLAALVLGFRSALGIVALSAISYAALFFWHVPVEAFGHAHHAMSPYSVHLQSMWVAFTVAALLLAYFVSRLAGALRARESDLALAQQVAAKNEKLASLSTLAAGAAHELGTPLGTIAIASKELERSILGAPEEALADARLIRAEVERCRAIIQRMSAQSGEAIGEVPEETTPERVLSGWVSRAGATAEDVEIDGRSGAVFVCPVEGLLQVLTNLVQNARYASRASGTKVKLRADATPTSVRFIVEDQGAGLSQELLARVGEPFFTTKPPGDGMGLGLFLANTFVERCGGSLSLASEEHKGTRVTIELPRVAEGPHGDMARPHDGRKLLGKNL